MKKNKDSICYSDAEAWEKRGAYNSADYHSDKRYIEKNRAIAE